MSDTKKIRATKAAGGMLPGRIYDKPKAIADLYIKGGHAVSVDTLAEREASERTSNWEPNDVVTQGEPMIPPTSIDPADFPHIQGVADQLGAPDVDVQSDKGALDAGLTGDDGPTHEFEPYDANPTICRHCGAVQPMPCYRIEVG